MGGSNRAVRAPGPVTSAAASSLSDSVPTASPMGCTSSDRSMALRVTMASFTATSADCSSGEIRSIGARSIAPSLGASSDGCRVLAISTSEGITSVASESTVSVTSRMASRLGPTNGKPVAARNSGSSTADLAEDASACRSPTVPAVAVGSDVVMSRSSSCSSVTFCEAACRWSYAW